jgi:biotin transport system substrate-specific component
MKAREVALVAVFAALTALGGWLALPVPFSPVPFTLQVFFVLLAGSFLGAKLGSLSQIVYLLMGLIGLPVFSRGTAGLGVLLGPTGGYLVGFILAAGFVGLFANHEKFWLRFLVMVLGVGLIYLLGAAQLMLVAKLSWLKALSVGVLPFLAFDILKAFLAASLAPTLKKHAIWQLG